MTLSVRALDANGDWTFGQGLQNYLTGTPSVGQRIYTRLRCVKNDWFLNYDFGIDYFSANPEVITEQIRTTILSTDGVVELLEFNVTLNDNRVLSISATVRDEAGELIEVNT